MTLSNDSAVTNSVGSEYGPALIVMVGAPGTGKSTLARRVARRFGCRLIQTDSARKELFPEPQYTKAENERVYGEAHRRIEESLAAGQCVVFDATNLQEKPRTTLYEIARRHNARLIVLVTWAPVSVVRERLRNRVANPSADDLSDANWNIYLRLRRSYQPVGVPHIVVNTTREFEPVLKAVERALSRN